MPNETLENAIDNLLPQTQCRMCGYGGCRPYAKAICEQDEQINLCPPGGTKTLLDLGNLLQKDVAPLMEPMRQQAKPPSRVVIRESECIGCTKCIQACPVDAILGSSKKMHTVIASECTGCDLCIDPCPVDCIDRIMLEPLAEDLQKKKAAQARSRFELRNKRLAKISQSSKEKNHAPVSHEEKINSRKTNLQKSIARAKLKKGLPL